MKTTKFLTAAVLCAFGAAAHANSGYVFSPDGTPVRSSTGHCVRTGSWTPADTDPCAPPVTAAAVPAPAVLQTPKTTVLFAFDQAVLTDVDQRTLDQVAATIPAGAIVGVTGHADAIGTKSYNQRLSERRAGAVAAYLAQRNPAAGYVVEGVGSTEPTTITAHCASVRKWTERVACYAPDRRVTVSVSK